MHMQKITADCENGWNEYTVHHNGDFSGDILITVPAQHVEALGSHERSDRQVRLPFSLLRELVGAALIRKHISEIEQMSGEEFLDA